MRICKSRTGTVAEVVNRQNNALLDELAGKVSALRGVTVDIYENARNHELIDSNV